jgi:N-acetylglucosamine kinase-like BadF-type ATPase
MAMSVIADIIDRTCRTFCENKANIDAIYMYTAGVVTESITEQIRNIFHNTIPHAEVDVFDDLTAAARAVCGHNAGIAAILGTGSNSCQYDGQRIVKRIYSGGFILGDEGSAATLGKLFIADLLKGFIPQHIADDFSARHKSDYSSIVESVYRSASSPSAYLGSLAPFIVEYYDHPYIKRLVDDNFRAFIIRSLKQYDTDHYAVGVVGGFGNALKEIFSNIAQEEGVRISRFVATPIEELIKYHTL